MVEAKYQIEGSEHRCVRCEHDIECGDPYYSAVVFLTADQSFARRDFCVQCWESDSARDEPESGETVPGETVPGETVPGETVPGETVFFAYWKTRRPEPNAPPPTKIRFDGAIVLDFFRHLTPPEEDAEVVGTGSSNPVDCDSESGDSESGDSESGDSESGDSESGDGVGGEVSVGADLYPRQKRDLRFVLSLLLLRKKVLNFAGSAMEDGREWLKLTDKEDPPNDYWVENPELTEDELERVRDDLGELLQMNV